MSRYYYVQDIIHRRKWRRRGKVANEPDKSTLSHTCTHTQNNGKSQAKWKIISRARKLKTNFGYLVIDILFLIHAQNNADENMPIIDQLSSKHRATREKPRNERFHIENEYEIEAATTSVSIVPTITISNYKLRLWNDKRCVVQRTNQNNRPQRSAKLNYSAESPKLFNQNSCLVLFRFFHISKKKEMKSNQTILLYVNCENVDIDCILYSLILYFFPSKPKKFNYWKECTVCNVSVHFVFFLLH